MSQATFSKYAADMENQRGFEGMTQKMRETVLTSIANFGVGRPNKILVIDLMFSKFQTVHYDVHIDEAAFKLMNLEPIYMRYIGGS